MEIVKKDKYIIIGLVIYFIICVISLSIIFGVV